MEILHSLLMAAQHGAVRRWGDLVTEEPDKMATGNWLCEERRKTLQSPTFLLLLAYSARKEYSWTLCKYHDGGNGNGMTRADTIISSLVLVFPFPFLSLPSFSLQTEFYVSALAIIPTVVLARGEGLNKRKRKKGRTVSHRHMTILTITSCQPEFSFPSFLPLTVHREVFCFSNFPYGTGVIS